MTLLLDTHTALWLMEGSQRLGRKARRACDTALAANDLVVPSIVFFEVGFLLKRGKLKSSVSLRDWHAAVRALGVRELPFLTEIAIRASEIENLPGDPVDRIVVASAQVEDAVLLTTDGGLLDWPGQVRRQDAQR